MLARYAFRAAFGGALIARTLMLDGSATMGWLQRLFLSVLTF
jgi:hypothetical protein